MRDFLQALVYTGAFLVLFIPILVSDSLFFPYITGKNFAFRIIVDVIFAAWIILAFLDTRYRPRFSWILVSGGLLLIVMFFADLLGQYPLKSFWSNFERMEGYVMLVHFYLYFVVLAHILRGEKLWSYFFHTTLGVATYVALYGLAQTEGGVIRIDSTLGNAAYMAIYMLFHIFIIAYLFLHSKNNMLRVAYAIGAILFVYILLETGTRGTFIGLATGSFVAVMYMSLFGRGYPQVRKIAIGGVILVVLAAGTFFTFRDSTFVQNSPNLSRFANISLSDLKVRGTIWSMAFEGVKERPVLGWGQGNFNYVFNEQYDPFLYNQEAWFDRVHNIFFDWLIAGGVLGFVAYFGILISCLYYLFWRPLFKHDERNDDNSFTVVERALLLGILAGYFTHNLVVFDNLVSYMFYAVVLAFIHSRVGTEIPKVANYRADQTIVTYVGAPTVAVVAGVAIFMIHVPGIAAAHDIIVAFQSSDPDARFAAFERALDRDTFANQEIIEQMTQQAMNLAASPNVAKETKDKYLTMVNEHIKELIAEKPGDARLHVFYSGFFRNAGRFDDAQEQIDIAHSLSPQKQTIILEQGTIAGLRGDYEKMQERYKTAFELNEDYTYARVLYAASYVQLGEPEKVYEIMTDKYFKDFANNNMALTIADRNGANELLVDMIQVRIAADPANIQHRVSLAFVYYRMGNTEAAIAALNEARTIDPTFDTKGGCYVANLEAGREPAAGCE